MNSALERHRGYLRGDFNLADAVEIYLNKIESNKDLNAFIQVYAEEARQRANEIDAKRASGEKLGRLAGVAVSYTHLTLPTSFLV